MFNISNLTFDDFSFNGKWLTAFNGTIAGKDGIKIFSVLPSKEIKSEKIIGKDGELVYDSCYQPRSFTVPVLFNDLSKIRDISAWLNTKTPQDFYFKNDTIKIKAIFDSAIDIEAYCLQGIVELKFLCHSPFYELITDKYLSYTSLASTITFVNDGNKESYPKYKITATGTNVTIEFKINGISYKVDNVNGNVVIDTKYFTIYQEDTNGNPSINKLSNFTGNFNSINCGNNTLDRVTTNITKIEIWCRSEFI